MNAVYYDLLETFKTSNMNFDFGYDSLVIDREEHNQGIYIRYTPLHKESFCSYIKDTSFSFTSLPMAQEKFTKYYLEFMNAYTSQKRNTRYGVLVTIAYPKLLKDIRKRKKFVDNFVRDICGRNVDVPYFVEHVIQGGCEYAKITVIERIFLGVQKWKIHKRDMFIDTRTCKWAARSCPDEYRKQVCKAGARVVDKHGNNIPGTAVFSNTLRIFSFAKDQATKRNLWDEFIGKLKQIYINTLLNVCQKVQAVKGGKRLHKTRNKPEYHRYVKRRIAALNYAKQVIEYTTNYLLQSECEHDVEYQPYNHGKDPITKHTDKYKKIISVFMKYKERFKKKKFHDKEGLVYKIDYYDLRVDELDRSVDKLLRLFFDDLSALLGIAGEQNGS